MSEEDDDTPSPSREDLAEQEEHRILEEERRKEYLSSLSPEEREEQFPTLPEFDDRDVEIKEKDFDNFIPYFVETLNMMVDSEEKFKLLCALFLIGLFTGPNWYFVNRAVKDSYRAKAERVLFNIGGCLIGISGGSRKSATLKKMMHNFIYYLLELIPYTTEDTDGSTTTVDCSQLLAKDLTTAAFMRNASRLYDEKTDYHLFTMIHPEFSAAIANKNSKYHQGLFQLQSAGLSNERMDKGTIESGDMVIEKPYFSMMIAVQEDYTADLGRAIWIQGYPNRFLYAVDTLGLFFPYKGNRTFLSPTDLGEPVKRRNKIREWLSALQSTIGDVQIFMYDASRQLIADFNDWATEELKKEQLHPYYSGYLGRLPVFALKLSCIHRIARITLQELKSNLEYKERSLEFTGKIEPVTYFVDELDTQWGIAKARHYYDEFKMVVDLQFKKATTKTIYTDEALFKRAYKVIDSYEKKNKGAPCPWSHLTDYVKVKKRNLEDAVTYLIDSKRIRTLDGKNLGDYGLKFEVLSDWDTSAPPKIDESDFN